MADKNDPVWEWLEAHHKDDDKPAVRAEDERCAWCRSYEAAPGSNRPGKCPLVLEFLDGVARDVGVVVWPDSWCELFTLTKDPATLEEIDECGCLITVRDKRRGRSPEDIEDAREHEEALEVADYHERFRLAMRAKGAARVWR